MRSFIGKCTASALVVSLILGPSGIYAEESATASEAAKSSQTLPAEVQWRKDLKDAKDARTGLMVTGGVFAIGGLGAMIAGNVKASTAGSVDGCQRDGLFNVTCQDQESLDEANDRIDSGRQMMVVGLIVGLVGGAFLWGGSNKSSEIDDLERKGKKNGYTLSFDQTNDGRFRLLMVKAF
jgi:hypothetical protein